MCYHSQSIFFFFGKKQRIPVLWRETRLYHSLLEHNHQIKNVRKSRAVNSRWTYFRKFCWCSEHVLLAKHQLAMIGWCPHMLLKSFKMLSQGGDGLGWDGTGQHSLGSWLPSTWLAISLLCAYKESNTSPDDRLIMMIALSQNFFKH